VLTSVKQHVPTLHQLTLHVAAAISCGQPNHIGHFGSLLKREWIVVFRVYYLSSGPNKGNNALIELDL
jgi:hypothetical protein